MCEGLNFRKTKSQLRKCLDNQINFASRTALLTPQDAQIASTLRNIYPDVTTALNSSGVAQMRMNYAVKEFASTSQDAARGFALDFEHALVQADRSGIRSQRPELTR